MGVKRIDIIGSRGAPKSPLRVLSVAGGVNYPTQLNLGRSWGKLWAVISGTWSFFFPALGSQSGNWPVFVNFFQNFLRIALEPCFFYVIMELLCLIESLLAWP